jgi:hypothetical protein
MPEMNSAGTPRANAIIESGSNAEPELAAKLVKAVVVCVDAILVVIDGVDDGMAVVGGGAVKFPLEVEAKVEGPVVALVRPVEDPENGGGKLLTVAVPVAAVVEVVGLPEVVGPVGPVVWCG